MEIKEINMISSLQWNSINDDCLICNNPIGTNCIKCNQHPLNNTSTIPCLSVINNNTNCKHSFHIHCLSQYHRANHLKCPVCIDKWIN